MEIDDYNETIIIAIITVSFVNINDKRLTIKNKQKYWPLNDYNKRITPECRALLSMKSSIAI